MELLSDDPMQTATFGAKEKARQNSNTKVAVCRTQGHKQLKYNCCGLGTVYLMDKQLNNTCPPVVSIRTERFLPLSAAPRSLSCRPHSRRGFQIPGRSSLTVIITVGVHCLKAQAKT